MSITFYVENTPWKPTTEECYACDGAGVTLVDDGVAEVIGGTCQFCKGEGTIPGQEPAWSSANFSNQNAADLLRMLGLQNEPDGNVPANMVRMVHDLAVRIVNDDSARTGFIQEPSESRASRVDRSGGSPKVVGGPLVINCGVSDDSIVRRLRSLLEVINKALLEGQGIYWE